MSVGGEKRGSTRGCNPLLRLGGLLPKNAGVPSPLPPPILHTPTGELTAKVTLDPEVTVAMSACGNAQTTYLALQALFRAAEGDYELLLVDDCSPEEGVRDVFRQARVEHANTTLFFFPENREYSGSLEVIFAHAQGRWILFVSNDVFVTPDYLRELLAAARADPAHGIVRGCSNFVDNGKASHNVKLAQLPDNLDELFAVAATVARDAASESLVDEFLIGDAFLVSRAVLDRIGTLDPLFHGYFADIDFGLRAQIAGFRQILVPRAFAFHHQRSNVNYLPEPQRSIKIDRRWSLVHENWARFKLKYRLPVALPFTSLDAIPWAGLVAEPFDRQRHYFAPRKYRADDEGVNAGNSASGR